MAENLPMAASHEVSVKIAKRMELAVHGEEGSIAYIWPDLDKNERRREMGLALYRLSHQMLDEAESAPPAFHCEGCACDVSGPEKAPHGQEDAPESEWAGLAKGTSNGTPVVEP